MGNHLASCTMARVPGAARGAKVVLPDGAVRAVKVPAKAAELMLEAPGHFSRTRALRAWGRIAALGADEDLELGGLYAAFPMKRLGAPAAPADMARLAAAVSRDQAAARVVRHGQGGGRRGGAAARRRDGRGGGRRRAAEAGRDGRGRRGGRGGDQRAQAADQRRPPVEAADVGDHTRGELRSSSKMLVIV